MAISGVSSMGVNPYGSEGTDTTANISVLKKAMNSQEEQMATLLQGMQEANQPQPSQLAAQTSGLGVNLNAVA